MIMETSFGTVSKCPIFVSKSFLGASMHWKILIFMVEQTYILENHRRLRKKIIWSAILKNKRGVRAGSCKGVRLCSVYSGDIFQGFRKCFLFYPDAALPPPLAPAV